MDNNKIMKFDGKLEYTKGSHFFPEYFLNYLRAFGIFDTMGNYYYYYDGEKLDLRIENTKIVFSLPKKCEHLVEIDVDKSEIYFKEGDICGSVKAFSSNGHDVLRYCMNGRIYNICIYRDVLGNVTISYNTVQENVEIRVGEEHDDINSYMDVLKDKIDLDEIYDENGIDAKMVRVMLYDPRILNRVSYLVSLMAPDIETAYNNVVKEIQEKYQNQINKIIELQDKEIQELTDYKESYNNTIKKK